MSNTLLRPTARGFTLVEILIVVVILAILAAITIPQFSSAMIESRENALRMNLHRIRQQLEVYRHQHNTYPSVENFAAQMTQYSNAEGETSSTLSGSYPYGPYIQEIPPNPFTGGNTVSDQPIGSSDWYFNPLTGEFRDNHAEKYQGY